MIQNTGAYIATLIGIRADYRGHICGPTGEPYTVRARIAYYQGLYRR